MSKVTKEQIAEAAKHGIVPGVTIACAEASEDRAVVPPTDEWSITSAGVISFYRVDELMIIVKSPSGRWAEVTNQQTKNMSKVSQELINEAAARGIVPGAVVHNGSYEQFTVPDTSKWRHVGGGRDSIAWLTDDGAPHDYCWVRRDGDMWSIVDTPAPPVTPLEENDAVECDTPMRLAIIKMALALGLPVYEGTSNKDEDREYPNLTWSGSRLVGISRAIAGRTIYTPEQFIAKMLVTKPQPKPIKIDDSEVRFMANGDVTVGCTRVPFETIKAVYERAAEIHEGVRH